jgi:RNA polymerase sigma-70 factor (ECF subfamily)
MGDEVTPDRQDDRQRARFEQMYQHTRVPILGYLARRSESPEDAADLLAEVYLIAWRRIDDVPSGDRTRLWLYGVARRVLANHHRRTHTETGLAAALQTSLRSSPRELGEPGATDPRAESVPQALARLNADDRELLTLSAWEGLTPVQIAVVLRQPASVVRVRLHRARARLRTELEATPAPHPAKGRVRPRRA